MYDRGYHTTREKLPPKRKISKMRKKSWKGISTLGALWGRFRMHTIQRRVLQMVVGGGIGIGVGALALIFWFNHGLPTPTTLIIREKRNSTRIVDRTGTINLFEIYETQKRTPVILAQIPQTLRWATLVAEDKNFYRHGGFSIPGIFRAIIVDILKGKKSQGGSTITQQLIKNALLSQEKTFARKIKELILAYKIERSFSKDEILEMYLNEIPYGGTTYGIEAASKTFFGKSSQKLTLAQSAVLAALPKAPSYYSPYGQHRDELIWRQQYILNQMEGEGYISPQERDQAKQEKLAFNPSKDRILAPHFVMYVRELAAALVGDDMLSRGGLIITTTLDMKKQSVAERAISEGAEKNEKTANAKNAALISLDPKNGEVLALVGSRDYFDLENDGNVNVVLRPRQPGSSFKPLVYLAAFQNGYSPSTILFDVETDFKTTVEGIYHPENYNGQTYGPVTLRQSLAGSLNIPSVKLLYLVGVNTVLDLADALGYTTLKDRSRFGLSLVLGGGEVKLLEHVRAYAALAREGILPEITSILKITDAQGNILFEYKPKPGKRISENPEPFRQVTSILTDREARRFVFGEGTNLILGSRPVAVKTGTTNDFRDAWTIGYTPSLVAGVWVGNNNNQPMKKGLSSMVAAPIWHAFMEAATKDQPIENFRTPQNNPPPPKPMLNGTYLSEIEIPIDMSTGGKATSKTPPELISLRKETHSHTILHYIDRENPLGPSPTNPEQDEQYASWEAAVQEWEKTQGVQNIEPPSQDIRTAPRINISSPISGASIVGLQIPISFELTPRLGHTIERLEYLLDNKLIIISSIPETEKILTLPSVVGKRHLLTVRAIDSVGQVGSNSISLVFPNAPEDPFKWIKPSQQSFLSKTNFPVPLIISTPPDTKKIDFYIHTEKDKKWIGLSTDFSNFQGKFVWSDAPTQGIYQITAVFTLQNGSILTSEALSVTIQ